ncbi:MAG: FAD-dependent oxidoreductase [Planctomycetota bacterium]|nr:FAD-dependent oxidoreductase [Planctomycetota bacterium]
MRARFDFAIIFLVAHLTRVSPAALIEIDVCIYGGTSAGVIAAIPVANSGKQVVLVEAGQHLGGMSVEGLGGTDIDSHAEFQNSPAVGGLALEFYRRVSARYGKQRAFDNMVRNRAKQSGLWRFESHVAEAVFEAWIKEAGVKVLRGHRLKEINGVGKKDSRIESLHFEKGAQVSAKVFIDATYEGDLLAFAGISFVVGREGNEKYGESKNSIRTDTKHGQFYRSFDPYRIPGKPESGLIFGVQDGQLGVHGQADDCIQGYCFRLCLTKRPSNRVPLEKPANFDSSRYELHRRYVNAGGIISPPGAGLPGGKTAPGSWHHLAGNFTGWNHRYPMASYTERKSMLRECRDYIHGFYWFMAHDESVSEKQCEQWAAWGLCKDEFADNEGWPRTFYVRNGRRMVSDFVLTEAHVRKASPEPIDDSVGLVWWPPDLHHAQRIAKDGRVWNEGAVFDESKNADWIPCGIPYRCLIPKYSEYTNLLTPTCPSSSDVGYGAYRIEFTFMVAAHSAATAAVMAIAEGNRVQDMHYPKLRDALLDPGQILTPPDTFHH